LNLSAKDFHSGNFFSFSFLSFSTASSALFFLTSSIDFGSPSVFSFDFSFGHSLGCQNASTDFFGSAKESYGSYPCAAKRASAAASSFSFSILSISALLILSYGISTTFLGAAVGAGATGASTFLGASTFFSSGFFTSAALSHDFFLPKNPIHFSLILLIHVSHFVSCVSYCAKSNHFFLLKILVAFRIHLNIFPGVYNSFLNGCRIH
jgi:hypothetical protein